MTGKNLVVQQAYQEKVKTKVYSSQNETLRSDELFVSYQNGRKRTLSVSKLGTYGAKICHLE